MDRQFPPEVVLLIVEASLDPYDSFDMNFGHIPRYITLCKYSRLNSVWRNISRPLLYESVVVTTYTAEEKLLSTLEGGGGELEMIRAFSVRHGRGYSSADTTALLDYLRDRVESLSLSRVHFSVRRGAQKLRRLLLEYDDQVKPAEDWRNGVAFPQLHTFHIEYSASSISLPAQHCPLLQSFYSHYSTFVPSRSLIGQLTALHVDFVDHYEELLPHASQLKLLSIYTNYTGQEIFPLLDKTPRFLHLNTHSAQDAAYVLGYQIEVDRSGLETVFWDDANTYWNESHADDEEDWEEMVSEYSGILATRGVKFVRGRIGFRNAVGRMEAILAKEKRAAEDKEHDGR